MPAESAPKDPFEKKEDRQLGNKTERILKEAGVKTKEELDQRIDAVIQDIESLNKTLAENKFGSPEDKERALSKLADDVKLRDSLLRLQGEYIEAQKDASGDAKAKAEKLEKNNDVAAVQAEIQQIDARLAGTPPPTAGEMEGLAVRRAELKKQEAELLESHKAEAKRAARAAELRRYSSEHAQEAQKAEADLEQALNGNPETPGDDKKKGEKDGEDKSQEDAEAKAQQAERAAYLDNRVDRAAYGLAVDLARTKPGDDANFFDKAVWGGKKLLMQILTMFGGEPKWAKTLDKDQQDKIGMVVSETPITEGDHAGETKVSIKWTDPIDVAPASMNDVFVKAFGSDKDTALKDITDKTSLADYVKNLAPSPSSELEKNKVKFADALKKAGAKDDTNIQTFLKDSSNAKRTIDILNPDAPADSTSSGKEAVESASAQLLASSMKEVVLPAMADANYKLDLKADTPLIEAYTRLAETKDDVSQADKTQHERMAKLVKGEWTSKDYATAVLGDFTNKDGKLNADIKPDTMKPALTALGIDTKVVDSIVKDAEDGGLGAESLGSINTAALKRGDAIPAAYKGTLGDALKAYKPANADEKAVLDAANSHLK